MRLKLFLSIGILLILLILGTPILQRSLGYFPGAPGWKVAEIAAQKHDVELCNRIIDLPWGIFSMGPTSDESSMLCIHEYAKLTKDPSACELLMPSSYGLSCVGAAENSQMPCNTNVKPYSVYWRDGEKENLVDVRECATSKVQRTELGTQCCQVARIAYMKDENDCSPLQKNPIVYDRCLYSLAWKLKEPSYCSGIGNRNAKAACTVQSKAIKDDPNFCPGCVTPLESIDDVRALR